MLCDVASAPFDNVLSPFFRHFSVTGTFDDIMISNLIGENCRENIFLPIKISLIALISLCLHCDTPFF